MFATLIGTDTGDVTHRALFDELQAIATRRGYAPPDTALRVQPDGSLDGWSLEHMGPPDRSAEFLLAVTAPRVPGISPVFPVRKAISGPLFAVVVLDSVFVVWRDDRRDVSEVKDGASVAAFFESFLDGLPRTT